MSEPVTKERKKESRTFDILKHVSRSPRPKITQNHDFKPLCPTLPYPTLPYPTLPYPTLPYPTLPNPHLPYPTLPNSYPPVPTPQQPTHPTLPRPQAVGSNQEHLNLKSRTTEPLRKAGMLRELDSYHIGDL